LTARLNWHPTRDLEIALNSNHRIARLSFHKFVT
jgi:hypothetical protein